MWRGLEVTQAWPKARGKNLNPKTKAQMEYFRQVQWAFKFSAPDVQISYTQAVAGTPLMPRDLFLMASSGRMHIVHDTEGRKWFSVQARKNISDSLDVIAQLPGQLLARAADGWAPLTPGDIGLVLTSSGPDSVPTWQEPSGAAVFTETADGLVPAPNEAAGLFLRDDGTWQPSTSEVFTETVDGLVPAPNEAAGLFLRDDGTWQTSTSAVFTETADGLVPAPNEAAGLFLRDDGSWQPAASGGPTWSTDPLLADMWLSQGAIQGGLGTVEPVSGKRLMLYFNAVADPVLRAEQADGTQIWKIGEPNSDGTLSIHAPVAFSFNQRPEVAGEGLALLSDIPGNAGNIGGGLTLIENYTADGTTGTHTFAAIPATYRDLMLRITGRSTAAVIGEQVAITVNGLTTGIYDIERLVVIGTSIAAAQSLGAANWGPAGLNAFSLPGTSAAAGDVGGGEMIIQAYAQTAFNKLMHGRARHPSSATTHDGYIIQFTGQARLTAAIASLTVALPAGHFVSGTQISLYATS